MHVLQLVSMCPRAGVLICLPTISWLLSVCDDAIPLACATLIAELRAKLGDASREHIVSVLSARHEEILGSHTCVAVCAVLTVGGAVKVTFREMTPEFRDGECTRFAEDAILAEILPLVANKSLVFAGETIVIIGNKRPWVQWLEGGLVQLATAIGACGGHLCLVSAQHSDAPALAAAAYGKNSKVLNDVQFIDMCMFRAEETRALIPVYGFRKGKCYLSQLGNLINPESFGNATLLSPALTDLKNLILKSGTATSLLLMNASVVANNFVGLFGTGKCCERLLRLMSLDGRPSTLTLFDFQTWYKSLPLPRDDDTSVNYLLAHFSNMTVDAVLVVLEQLIAEGQSPLGALAWVTTLQTFRSVGRGSELVNFLYPGEGGKGSRSNAHFHTPGGLVALWAEIVKRLSPGSFHAASCARLISSTASDLDGTVDRLAREALLSLVLGSQATASDAACAPACRSFVVIGANGISCGDHGSMTARANRLLHGAGEMTLAQLLAHSFSHAPVGWLKNRLIRRNIVAKDVVDNLTLREAHRLHVLDLGHIQRGFEHAALEGDDQAIEWIQRRSENMQASNRFNKGRQPGASAADMELMEATRSKQISSNPSNVLRATRADPAASAEAVADAQFNVKRACYHRMALAQSATLIPVSVSMAQVPSSVPIAAQALHALSPASVSMAQVPPSRVPIAAQAVHALSRSAIAKRSSAHVRTRLNQSNAAARKARASNLLIIQYQELADAKASVD